MTTGDKIIIAIAIGLGIVATCIALHGVGEVARFNRALSSECRFLADQMDDTYAVKCR